MPQAAAVELATLTTCERNEAATQQARLERLQCAKGRAQKQAQAATRFARAEEWCAHENSTAGSARSTYRTYTPQRHNNRRELYSRAFESNSHGILRQAVVIIGGHDPPPTLGRRYSALLDLLSVPNRAEAQAAAMAELGGVMVAAVNEDALLLRLTTAEVTTDAGALAPGHMDRCDECKLKRCKHLRLVPLLCPLHYEAANVSMV